MSLSESDFCFIDIRRTRFKHTDNRQGVHTHYLAYMRAGWARLVSENEDITIQAGDMLYIPRYCRYQSYWYGDPEVAWISLGFRTFPDPEERQFPLQRIVPDETDRTMVLQIPLGRAADCTSVGLFLQLFGRLLPRMATADPDPHAALIRKSVRYMEAHPQASVPELAKECGISESGYYALFRAVTGRTPVAMKQKIRAEQAAALLTGTDLPVEAISDRLGFSSAAYFRKVLRAQLGCTPRELRSRRHEGI